MFLAPSIFGLFKWRQFEPDVILLAVGWYLRFSLSYRDVRELLAERGVRAVDFQFHTKLSSDTVQLRNAKSGLKQIYLLCGSQMLRFPTLLARGKPSTFDA
jgi:hypothetical protein